MKVYPFNIETGLYAGELFEDETQLKYVEAVTTVAPPPYEKGQVPVFDSHAQSWKVLTHSELTLGEMSGRLVQDGLTDHFTEKQS